MAVSARRWIVPGMALLLLGYVAAHSPVQRLVARLVGSGGTCYFACSGWVPYGRPLDAAAAIACLLATAWAAWLASRRLDTMASERALAFGMLAIAFVVVPAGWVGLLAWAGDTRALRPPLGPLLTALPAVLVALLVRSGRGHRAAGRPRWPRLVRTLAIVAALLLLISTIVSLAHPPTGYDALSYHGPLAVYYWREGDLGSYLERQPWAWALAHPGSAELWFGLLRIAAGERVASLGQMPYALTGALAVHVLGRRTGLPAGLAALGGLAFLLAPLVVIQSGMQLNDLAAGALVLTAMAIAAAPAAAWSKVRVGGIGLALGLAVTTKLAVLPAAAGVMLFALFRLRHAGAWRAAVGYGALAFVAAGLPWWLRNALLFDNPIFPAALPILGRGYVVGDFMRKDTWFVPSALAWPLYPVIEPHGEMSGFGALFLVGALPGLIVALVRARRGPLALVALVALPSLVAWWRLTQHEPRLLLGVVGAGFLGVGWVLLGVPRAHRRVAALVLGVAAVYSAAVTLDQGVRPLAVLSPSRAAFYELEWGIDSVAAGLPDRDGLLYHTGWAHRSYAGDYPLLGPTQRRTIAVIDGVHPPDSIAHTMRRLELRYAYVPVRVEDDSTVRSMYPPDRFLLTRTAPLDRGLWKHTRRYLFELRGEAGR